MLHKAPGFAALVSGLTIVTIATCMFLGKLLPDIVSGLLIGIGVALLSTGLNEMSKFYSTTTVLRKPILDLEVFQNKYSIYRVSALIHNKGSIIIEDAKAVMILKKPASRTLRRILVEDCNKCPVSGLCTGKPYLVNRVNPKIEGELLPWALPEKPIKRPVRAGSRYVPVIYTDYTHVTSISPYQAARLLLFECIPMNNNEYLIRFFSEYGAPGPSDPSPRYYRACLLMSNNIVIKVIVTVSGKGLRKPLRFNLTINKNILGKVLEYIKKEDFISAMKILQQLFK